MQETWVWSLGREDPLEKEMATHSRTLAWKIPWMEEPGRLQSVGRKELDMTEQLHWFTGSNPRGAVGGSQAGQDVGAPFKPIFWRYPLCSLRWGWDRFKQGPGLLPDSGADALHQGSPTFLAPGTDFVVDSLSMDQGLRNGFKMIRANSHLSCTLFLLLLRQLHLWSPGIRSRRLETPALRWVQHLGWCPWAGAQRQLFSVPLQVLSGSCAVGRNSGDELMWNFQEMISAVFTFSLFPCCYRK